MITYCWEFCSYWCFNSYNYVQEKIFLWNYSKWACNIAVDSQKQVKMIAIPCDISIEENLKDFSDKTNWYIRHIDCKCRSYKRSYIEGSSKIIREKGDTLEHYDIFHTSQLFTPLLEVAGAKTDPPRIIIFYRYHHSWPNMSEHMVIYLLR